MDVFIANDNLVMVPINDGVTAIIMCRTGKIVVANKATTNLISFCAVPQTLETLYRDLKSFGYAELKEEEIEQCVKSLIAEGTMHLDSVEPFNSCRYQTCILPFPEAAPKTMYLHPTHNCNLLCSYCYNKVVRKSDPCIEHELSFDEWNSIVEQIIDIGVESIIITGGEPLIRSELLYTWKKAKLAGLSVTLGTNGVLIVDKFMAAKVSDSVSLINLSIDSYDSSVHDIDRDKGSHKQVVKAAKLLTEVGAQWQGQTVVSKRTIEGLGKTAAFVKSLGALRHTVSFLISSDREPDNEVTGLETESCSSQINTDDASSLGLFRGCGAGRTVASIDPYGRVYPCHLLHVPEFASSSLRSVSLSRAWFESEGLNRYRSFDYASVIPCGRCSFFEMCLGGCRGIGFMRTGTVDGFVGDLYCRRRKRYITHLASFKARSMPISDQDKCGDESILYGTGEGCTS